MVLLLAWPGEQGSQFVGMTHQLVQPCSKLGMRRSVALKVDLKVIEAAQFLLQFGAS